MHKSAVVTFEPCSRSCDEVQRITIGTTRQWGVIYHDVQSSQQAMWLCSQLNLRGADGARNACVKAVAQ